MDKQPKLKYLMMTGAAAGILFSLQASSKQSDEANSDFMELVARTGGNITFRPMTEDELMLQLNEEGAHLYRSLTPEGKKLALSVASRSCNGTNECKGLNACATDKNKCAGKGNCKGQTKCAVSDRNLAVKIAARKIAEKRANLNDR